MFFLEWKRFENLKFVQMSEALFGINLRMLDLKDVGAWFLDFECDSLKVGTW